MKPDSDILIVGAGCAGLSLAAHLRGSSLGERRIDLVDPRTTFRDDRTWCFFNLEGHLFADAVTHRWHRWSVVDDRHEVQRRSPRVAYEHLPAGTFYRRALELIAPGDKRTLHLDTKVESIRDCGDHVRVQTSRGELRSRLVFDSRPHAPAEGSRREVHLLQHFVGWFVRTEQPAFDPERVTLMDFRVDQSRGIHFTYVLPFSRTEALVEDTFFSEEPVRTQVYEDNLRRYLESHGIHDYEITRREAGVIPMSTRPFERRPSRRVYRLGIGGGLARPATGYAFLAIQRFSRQFAAALRRNPLPDPPSVRNPRTAWLDRVFLSYLQNHPHQGPRLFTMLFAENPPELVARFLSERSSLVDDLRIMQSLPSRGLAPEAARTVARLVGTHLVPRGRA